MSVTQLRQALMDVPSDQMVTIRAGDVKALLRKLEDAEQSHGRLNAQVADMNRMYRSLRKSKGAEP